ncbi:50S ribosomal protein L4 [Candidatus Collierbacteria bacterium RIFOXYB1_FULL_49_13]|uniref:Large ribosomal subunit protein uL4 n=1 Tax=Candidatus Collierbacteria bacterium RIFOXYB1_FULL_49_13 TaxID=1817728 RepID=A0A1F5FHL7_9BACT|nr:ribosomal protein L4 [uncultured bacterium]OGD79138.1 MAG: 50S ribosomal protein L4 [Candidatus Collierbacteria bacterium RIFOXYB1_FULL_49_13]
MKATLINFKDNSTSTAELPAAIFGVSVSPSLIAQAIRVYSSNFHQSTSKVQTRGEVSLTTAKAYKQKGTGKARHGAKSAPIFVGGGVAHGPKGIRPGRLKLNQKMRHLSLLGVLAGLAADGRVFLATNLDSVKAKTSELDKVLKSNSLDRNTMIITSAHTDNFVQAVKNLRYTSIVTPTNLNAYSVSRHHRLLIDTTALPELAKTFTAAHKAIEFKLTVPTKKATPKKTTTKKVATKAK